MAYNTPFDLISVSYTQNSYGEASPAYSVVFSAFGNVVNPTNKDYFNSEVGDETVKASIVLYTRYFDNPFPTLKNLIKLDEVYYRIQDVINSSIKYREMKFILERVDQ